MIPGLGTQTREFLMAGLLGLGLGVCYDWGRVHRRVFPRLTLPMDMLFALVLFLVLMLISIYTRGLKLYQLLGMALGGSLYFLLLSRWLTVPLFALLGKIRHVLRAGKKYMKKIPKILRKLEKKLFPSLAKWSTIDTVPFLPMGKYLKRKGADPCDQTRNRKSRGRSDGGLGRMESGKSGKHAQRGKRPGAGVG